ncbi:hypothetical protein IAT40_007250 [Kwoniella sp. CBS 6097]
MSDSSTATSTSAPAAASDATSTKTDTSQPTLPEPAIKAQVTLLPEIWALVIPHLKREMPATASIRNPNDYHQVDLARAMRVNKVFYEIASPILYERVIVSDLPRFFYGVPSLKPRVENDYDTPKIKLFRHIKRLDLAYTSMHAKHRRSQSLESADSPNTKVDSPIYGEPLPAEILGVLDLPQEMVAPLTNDINMAHMVAAEPMLSWSMDIRAPPLFPNLRQISVGAFGEKHWDTHEPKFNKLKFTDMSTYTPDDPVKKQAIEEATTRLHQVFQNRFFGRFLANNCSPEHVCSHISTGPFTYLHNNHFPNEPFLVCDRTPPAKTYTTHLLEQINKGSWLHVVEGKDVVNRWIIDPVFWDVPADDQALVFNFLKMQFATRKALAEGINFEPETEIRVFNLLNSKMLKDVMPILAALIGTEPAELEKDREKVKEAMLWFLGVDGGVIAKVELMDDNPGVCPACGGGDDD